MTPIPASSRSTGIAAEYNGKFMVGQVVLRGGSVATPPGHIRVTYRNFFPPQARWQFSAAFAWQRTSDGHPARTRPTPQPRRREALPMPCSRGLAKSPKEIACKYFYDAAGSQLFDQICELPEYYQTRTETALLTRHAREIAALMGPDVEIVEFGAGSLRKVRILLDAAQDPRAYMPLDISGDYLRACGARPGGGLSRPDLAARWWATSPCRWNSRSAGNPRRAGFFPGSTIGNFRPTPPWPAAADARRAEWRRAADRRGPGEGPGAPACRL